MHLPYSMRVIIQSKCGELLRCYHSLKQCFSDSIQARNFQQKAEGCVCETMFFVGDSKQWNRMFWKVQLFTFMLKVRCSDR